MPKEYFSHDYNARNDPKCKALIKDFGMAGYGLYWALVEMMNEQGGKIQKFPALFKCLAEEFRVKLPLLEKQVDAFINEYHLFMQDQSSIWSESVLHRLSKRNEKRSTISDARSEAGKIGGVKSGESRRKKQTEANELKGKERKEKGKESSNTVIGIYPKSNHPIEISEMVIGQSIEYIQVTKRVSANKALILSLWEIFKTKNLTGKKFYRDDRDIISHFINSLKYENIQNGTTTHQQSAAKSIKPGTSEARIAAAKEY